MEEKIAEFWAETETLYNSWCSWCAREKAVIDGRAPDGEFTQAEIEKLTDHLYTRLDERARIAKTFDWIPNPDAPFAWLSMFR